MKSRLLTCLPLLGMLCYLHAVKGEHFLFKINITTGNG